MESARRIGAELAAQIHIGLLRILVFIEAHRRGLPDIYHRIGQRLARCVAHRALDVQALAGILRFLAARNVGAQGHRRGLRAPKGA